MDTEPIRIQKAKCGDGELEYFVFGRGETPMVILPGISLHSVMFNADAIAQAYDCFSERYRVYCLDRRHDLGDRCTVESVAEDTALALKYLGIEKAVIFGCSLGGMIGQCIAVDHPELVYKLILGSTMSRPNATSARLCNEWYCYAAAEDAKSLNRAFAQRVYSKAFCEQYGDILASMEDQGTPEELRHFAVLTDAFRNFDIYDRLPEIKCPVFVIGSWDDHTLSWEGAVEIAEKLRCDLFMYSGYGHAVYDEAPDYKQRLLLFMEE